MIHFLLVVLETMLTKSILGYIGVMLIYLNVGTPISWGPNATYLASYFTALN